MGEWKQNVPTRFDAEMIAFIDGEIERHKFENRSQYIRAAMAKWKRLIIAGTIQLLDLPLQQERRENCEQREQQEQMIFSGSGTELGKKPLVRVPSSEVGANRRALGNVSRRVVSASVAYVTSRIHSTRVSRWAA